MEGLLNEGCPQLNGIFLSTALKAMLEGKYYHIDMIFIFVCVNVVVWTGSCDEALLTKVHS